MTTDPWQLVSGGKTVDPDRLLSAVAGQDVATLDHRSKLLARDAVKALSDYWGNDELRRRLRQLSKSSLLLENMDFSPDEEGFPTLRSRLMTTTDPNLAVQMLRELGVRVAAPASIIVGGSIVLMLEKLIARTTEDIDLVDEVPHSIRSEYTLLDELSKRYGLKLTHFQSHFLPEGWKSRARSLEQFGNLDVHVVDPLDILTGKLFSRRVKDLDDIRLSLPSISRGGFESRIRECTSSFRSDPRLMEAASQNWFILTGEAMLPT